MDSSFYAFTTPLLLGVMALPCGLVQRHYRQHRYVWWMGAFLLLLALGLGLQLSMPPAVRLAWAMPTTSIYLLSCACLAQAMAQRWGLRLPWPWWAVGCVVVLAGMWYSSAITPRWDLRLMVLSWGPGALLAQVLWQLRQVPMRHRLDHAARALYGGMVVALVLRPVVLLQDGAMGGYWVHHNLSWVVTSAAALLLCPLLAGVLCTCPIVDQQQQLRWAYDHDALTGLLTRRALAQQCGEHPHARGWHYLVFIDLDHFKNINDACGHATGDAVLRQFGALLRQHLQGRGLAGRLGGEEFVVVWGQAAPAQVSQWLAELRQGMRAAAWPEAVPQPVTASFGLVQLQPAETWDHAMLRADMLLYAAKHAGRDCVRTDTAL